MGKIRNINLNENLGRRNNSRRCIVGALIASAVLGAACYLLPPSKISFEQAKRDKSRMVEYVSNLIKSIELPFYIDSVSYVPNHIERGAEGGVYQKRFAEMATKGTGGVLRDIGRRKIHSRTEIYDLAFEVSRDEKEMLNKIKHEKNMARILFEGFSQAPPDSFTFTNSEGKEKANTSILQLICELESYDYDLNNAIRTGLSKEYVADIRKNYFHHYKTLFAKGLVGDSNKINRLKATYFRNWMKTEE